MPQSDPRPDTPARAAAARPEADPRALPFQWSLLAWAALVGVFTGLAVVGFHYLLGFINNCLLYTSDAADEGLV